MRAALYARVSDNKQRENYSIPTQLQAMREYCAKNGMEVVKEYVEDESGARLIRPALGQIREDIAAGLFDVLMCHDVDRFGRNLGHQLLLEEEFAKYGVEVRYVLGDYKDTAEGRLTKHIKGVIAEYEREKIIERTFRGRLGRAKSGQVNISSREPYGYSYRSEERRGWLEIVPQEAEVVKEIYHLYVEEGLSCQGIAASITDRHIATRTRCPQWSPSTVRGILHNETYTGTWHDNKRKRGQGINPRESWVPVPVPPIISRELWESVQQRSATNRERLRRRPQYPYLLSGILRCGKCSRAFIGMTSTPGHDRQPKAYHYYRCGDSTRSWKLNRCHESKIHAKEADALVWERIVGALSNPDLLTREYARRLANGGDVKHQERLVQIDKLLKIIKTKIDRNLDLYVEEQIDMSSLKNRQHTLETQKISLERERTAIKQMLARQSTDLVSTKEFCELISEGLDTVTFDEKRKILRLLNIEGTVKDGVINLTGCIPSADSCDYRASQQSATR